MKRETAEMDITPMIDVVFLLLIFFIVCSTMGRTTLVQLPKAKLGVAVNPQTATVLTLAGFENDAVVYLGDETNRPLPADRNVQREEIVQAVELGLRQGKTNVVIKADRKLFHGEVHRIETAVASVSGVTLHIVVAND